MVEIFGQERENVYREFIKQAREAGFVRLICISREINYFAALFSVLTILEKELIKHEVIWKEDKKQTDSVFEIGIGENCAVKKGAVLSTKKEKLPKGVILLYGETLEIAVFNLCKSINHLTPDCLWSICVSMYGHAETQEPDAWCSPIRKESTVAESGEDYSSSEESKKENDFLGEEEQSEVYRDIAAEIQRLERNDDEKKSVQIIHRVYFAFSQWCTLHEALLNDFGVIQELGLFFQRKNTKHCLLENAEYLLNKFLATLGVSVASAQETSLNNLVGPLQKIVQKSFKKRQIYFKHYQYNLGFSHIEVFYSICSLIKKGAFIEAAFAFRNIKFIDVNKGLYEYKKAVSYIKKAIERRKVLRVHGIGLVLIPKGVVSFHSSDEISLMKKVFVNVYSLCRARNPHKTIIMTAYMERDEKYRVFFKDEEGAAWEDTEEKRLNETIRSILDRLENE